MASIRPTAKGGYRAFVHVKGNRDSRTFPTKREAQLWANQRELELFNQATKPAAMNHSLRDALRKYSSEVSEFKKGRKWEQTRLEAFERLFLPMDKVLGEVTTEEIERFRDSRLKSVKGATVLRELNLLSSVFTTAKIDWKWGNENPCSNMRKPKDSPHRERLLMWWEVKRLLRGLGYAPGKKITTTYQAVGLCLLLALRTGMRAGELCGLTWNNVRPSYCYLPDTKNGTPRKVPLGSQARRLLAQAEGWRRSSVLGLTTQTLDTVFRRIRDREKLEGFVFHDSRHTAATMLAKKFSPLELCKVFGWKDPKLALVYFNPTVDELAARLG